MLFRSVARRRRCSSGWSVGRNGYRQAWCLGSMNGPSISLIFSRHVVLAHSKAVGVQALLPRALPFCLPRLDAPDRRLVRLAPIRRRGDRSPCPMAHWWRPFANLIRRSEGASGRSRFATLRHWSFSLIWDSGVIGLLPSVQFRSRPSPGNAPPPVCFTAPGASSF